MEKIEIKPTYSIINKNLIQNGSKTKVRLKPINFLEGKVGENLHKLNLALVSWI
jgi:hypothetical protein